MDMSFLIPSKIRRQVLAFFVQDPEAQVYVRELARELNCSPQQAYRELLNLEGWGMLFSSKRGNQRVFRLNKKFVLFPAIRELFEMYEKVQNFEPKVIATLNWEEMRERYQKIPIPPDLIRGLKAKRKRPRAYAEEISLKKKGML